MGQTTTTTTASNGSSKLWGVPVAQWVSIIQGLGVPVMLLAFMCFMAYKYIPPVVHGHVELLETTRDTLKQMDLTTKRLADLTEEIASDTRDDRLFRNTVIEDHRQHTERLIQLCEAIGEENTREVTPDR